MRSLTHIALTCIIVGPLVAVVYCLDALGWVLGRRPRSSVATLAEWLEALRQGGTLGVLFAAVVSLTFVLFSDPLGVPMWLLRWFAPLPLLGGYLGAGIGIHLCGRDPGGADER